MISQTWQHPLNQMCSKHYLECVQSITWNTCIYWLRHREGIYRERQDPCTDDIEGKRWIQGSVCTPWSTVEPPSKCSCEVGGVRMQVVCHKTGHNQHWCIVIQFVLCKEMRCRITPATSMSRLSQKAYHPCQLASCNLEKEPDKWPGNTGSCSNGWKLEEQQLTIDWMDGTPAPKAVLTLLACKCTRSCKLPNCICLTNGMYRHNVNSGAAQIKHVMRVMMTLTKKLTRTMMMTLMMTMMTVIAHYISRQFRRWVNSPDTAVSKRIWLIWLNIFIGRNLHFAVILSAYGSHLDIQNDWYPEI